MGVVFFVVLLLKAMRADAEQEAVSKTKAPVKAEIAVPKLPDPVRVVSLFATLRILTRLVMSSKRGYCNASLVSRLWRETVQQVRVSAKPRNLPMFRSLVHACGGQIALLDLTQCAQQLQNGAPGALLSHCRRYLTTVSLYGPQIGDHTLATLSDAPELQQLSLSECRTVTDKGLESFKMCSNLKSISLSGCSGVTDAGLKQLIEGCPTVQHVDLSNNPQITDASLTLISNGWTKLESLNLAGCVDITDDGLAVLAASGAELVSLDLSFCELITDGGLEQISLKCQMLESFLVRGCQSVTDIGICAIAGKCSKLHVVSTEDCPRLSSKGIARLMERCPNLVAVYIFGCRAVSEVDIVPTFAQHPDVHLVTEPADEDEYFNEVYRS